MAKKQQKPKDTGDGDDSKRVQVSIHPAFLPQLKILCEQNASNLTEEVRRAIREMLQREGLWPPKATSPQDGV